MVERESDGVVGHENAENSPTEPPSHAAGKSRLQALSRHPIIASVVATVASAGLIAAIGLDRDAAPDPASTTPAAADSAEATTTSTVATTSTTIESLGSASDGQLPPVGLEVHLTDTKMGWPAALDEPFPALDSSQWPEGYDQLQPWLLERDAVFASVTMTLVLRGRDESGITVTGAGARVVEASDAAPAAYVEPEPRATPGDIGVTSQGVVEAEDWLLTIDGDDSVLSGSDAESKSEDEISVAGMQEEVGTEYFDDKVITIADGEVVPIRVKAQVRSCDCTWRIELSVITADGPATVVVDNDGEPFRLVADVPGPPRYFYTLDSTDLEGEPGIGFIERQGEEATPLLP